MDIFGISFNIDFKQQTTVAKEGIEYIAPSVSTVVAPRRKVQVLSYLNSFVSSQNLTLDSDISGNISAKLNFIDGTSTVF